MRTPTPLKPVTIDVMARLKCAWSYWQSRPVKDRQLPLPMALQDESLEDALSRIIDEDNDCDDSGWWMHHRVKNLAQACICEAFASTLHVHLFLSSDIWIILIFICLLRTSIHKNNENPSKCRAWPPAVAAVMFIYMNPICYCGIQTCPVSLRRIISKHFVPFFSEKWQTCTKRTETTKGEDLNVKKQPQFFNHNTWVKRVLRTPPRHFSSGRCKS